MIKEAIIHIPQKVKLDIIDISLLTVDEAKTLPEEIRVYSEWWWLQTSGNDSNLATCVNSYGSIFGYGDYVYEGSNAVRPALTISNLDSFGLEIGATIEIQGEEYIVITQDKVLYNDKPIRHRFDGSTNNFSDSEIKGIVDNWLKEEE